MFCTIAKAPAPVANWPVLGNVLLTGTCLGETDVATLPLFDGKLFRPPRI